MSNAENRGLYSEWPFFVKTLLKWCFLWRNIARIFLSLEKCH